MAVATRAARKIVTLTRTSLMLVSAMVPDCFLLLLAVVGLGDGALGFGGGEVLLFRILNRSSNDIYCVLKHLMILNGPSCLGL